MHLTFDAEKDALNIAKHGVTLAEAAEFEWADALIWPDQRRDYGEPRMVALGYVGLRLMALVYVERPVDAPTERRIISLRKANLREVSRYAET